MQVIKNIAQSIPNTYGLVFGVWLLILLFRPSVDLTKEEFNFKIVEKDISGTTTYKHGIDVSHFQGKIDWSVVDEKTSYVYLKATEGITYTDPRFHENASKIAGSDIPAGAYHFYEPSDDATQQAAHFVNTIMQYPLKLRPVLDIEITGGKSPKNISRGAKAFLAYVEKHTGCKPIIYTYASYWDDNLGKTFNDYPFWLADYSDKPEPPQKRKTYNLWQHSQTGFQKGIEGTVDRDLYQGTHEGFDLLMCSKTRSLAETL